MAYTDKTVNYNLPQWVGTDHPDFLTDLNPAYETIDTELNKNATNITAMSEDVKNVVEGIDKLTTEYDTINHQVADNTVDITNLQSNFGMAMSKIGENTGNIAAVQRTVNMHTEDITKLKGDVASITGGVTLWSNPDTTKEYPAQTIVLNQPASNFEFVIIVFYNTASTQNQYINVNIYVDNLHSDMFTIQNATGLYLNRRGFTFDTSTNVSFDVAYSIKYDGNVAQNNYCAIPGMIIGLYKKEGV